jgi:hypothetical protein
MKPTVVVIPLVLVLSGIACYLLVPLSPTLRLAILASDLAAAALVGFLLWRKGS